MPLEALRQRMDSDTEGNRDKVAEPDTRKGQGGWHKDFADRCVSSPAPRMTQHNPADREPADKLVMTVVPELEVCPCCPLVPRPLGPCRKLTSLYRLHQFGQDQAILDPQAPSKVAVQVQHLHHHAVLGPNAVDQVGQGPVDLY